MIDNRVLSPGNERKNGAQRMGEWIQRILEESPGSVEDEFILNQAELICLFRATDEENFSKRKSLSDQIADGQLEGSEKFEISLIDLRYLIDYIVDLSKEQELPEFFEKIEKRRKELKEERRKQTRKKKKSSTK